MENIFKEASPDNFEIEKETKSNCFDNLSSASFEIIDVLKDEDFNIDDYFKKSYSTSSADENCQTNGSVIDNTENGNNLKSDVSVNNSQFKTICKTIKVS